MPGHFVDDDHQQDVVGFSIDRKRLRTSTPSKRPLRSSLLCDLGDQLIGGRLADDVADDAEDVGVGRGVIAVHAHFADDARRGLRARRWRTASASTHDRRTYVERRRTSVERRVVI